jgi:hypothetical protein
VDDYIPPTLLGEAEHVSLKIDQPLPIHEHGIPAMYRTGEKDDEEVDGGDEEEDDDQIEWELISSRVGHDVVMFHLKQRNDDEAWNLLRQHLRVVASFEVDDGYHNVLRMGLCLKSEPIKREFTFGRLAAQFNLSS